MPSIYDIASSAVRAHKEALSSTSQNIANVDTEGYTRREAKLDEVSAKNDGLAAKGASVGLGVKVDQVRRAYDEVLAAQLRKIGSKFQSSQAFVANLERLENYLLPDGNLIDSINAFFTRLSAVAAEPGSEANRVAAIAFGSEVASAFSRTSESLNFLEAQIDQEAQFTVNRINELSSQLAKINKDISASFSTKGASPSLLDIRDQLLIDLAEIAGVSITIRETGEVRVDLGFDAVGATIVDGEKSSSLSYRLREGTISFAINETQPLTGFDAGLLRGISDSVDVLRKTEKELDALARRFVDELNSQHEQGMDLNGERGKPLFSSSQHDVTGINFDTEKVKVEISKKDGFSDKYQDIHFKYDGASDLWTAYYQGRVLGSGRQEISIDGFNIQLTGRAKSGDSFILSRSSGDAANLIFLLSDPRSLAATSSLIIDASSMNTGTAVAKIMAGTSPDTKQQPITEIFPNNLSPIASKAFLRGGAIGVIPKGVADITISSNAVQSEITFSSDNFENISRIELSIDGIAYTLSIPAGANDLNISGAADIADYFNSGLIRFQNNLGQSFDSVTLGVFGGGDGDTLKFSSSFKEIDSGSVLVDGLSKIGGISAAADASDIYVFTREGRQVAGKALGASEISSFITAENGFSEFAVYNAAYLSAPVGDGYRGLTANTVLSNPSHSLSFGVVGGANGISGSPLVNSQSHLNNFFDEQTITVSSGSLGLSETIKIPSNASAGTVAEVLNTELSEKGLQFSAQNKIQIEVDTVTGNPLSFDLLGKNTDPILIEAEYNSSTGVSGLVDAINAMSPSTGIYAEASSDSKRLVLTAADGSDIRLSNITNGNITVQGLDFDFGDVGNSYSMTPATTNWLVFSGLVMLQSSETVSIASSQGITLNSISSKYLSTSVGREFRDAGDTAIFEIKDFQALDGNSSADSSTLLHHGGHTVTLAINKADGTIETIVKRSSSLETGSGAEMAKALLAEVRTGAPIPKVESDYFISLPAEGAQMKFSYAEENYTLRYVAGELKVEGLDSHQFLAALTTSDQGYKLSISVPEGSVSGSALVPILNNGEAQFGFNSWTNSLTGNTPEALNVGESLTTSVKISDQTTVTVTLERLVDGSYQLSSTDASITAAFSNGAATTDTLSKITIKNNNINTSLTVIGGVSAAAMGFDTSREEVFLDGNKIVVRSVNGEPSDLAITSQRDQNNNIISLKDLPNEDLILLVANGGAKKISVSHNVKDASEELEDLPDLGLRLLDARSGRIGIFDQATGQLLAERKMNEGQPVNIYDYSVNVSGRMEEGDEFIISSNKKLELNGHNLDLLAQLGASNDYRQSYQDSYRNYLVDVGSKLSANRIELQSVTAQLEAAKEKVDEKSGVNLDTEAANLIQQQQSYQAAARLLQTARDMFDTIVKI
jgi:flagellar hook-associated protein 1 FlgK